MHEAMKVIAFILWGGVVVSFFVLILSCGVLILSKVTLRISQLMTRFCWVRILSNFAPITPTAHYKISHSYPAQPGNKRRNKNAN